MNLDELNSQHGISGQLSFKVGEANIPIVEVSNTQASAKVSLQGAQVLSWQPMNDKGEAQEDVIWVSDDATFALGKSVRGGIPICWPWFGAHESNSQFPAHGFARVTLWQVFSTESLEDGRTRISFILEPDDSNEAMWPPQTSVLFQLTIGSRLEMELVTHNKSDQAITISQALHTYFKVGDVSQVAVHGLSDTQYLDKLDDFKRKTQKGPITVSEEVDRVYLNTATDCVIEDKVLQRNIVIIKCGSHSTVVWNPWAESAAKMGDLGVDGYKQMLCVESSNAAEDEVVIAPGMDHHLWVQYELVPHSI